MDRRKFIRFAFGGTAAAMVAPKLVLAASSSAANMAGGLYYTREAPGRWAKKIDGHLPNIGVLKRDSGVVVKVLTAHEMDPYAHYIVKHIVLDSNFNFIAEHMFDPTKDKAPISEISVGNYRGVINVLSVCNKHDTWLNTAEV
jgi:superoxide reductase